MTIFSFYKERALALFFFWFLVGCGHATTPAERQGFSQEKLNEISAFYEGQVTAGVLPGAVILISRKGEIIFEDVIGYADLEMKKPLKRDSLFRIYSMTKPVITAATLQQVESDRLTLDMPVSEYLPEFENISVGVVDENGAFAQVPAKTVMTVRHLLTHTAGFPASWQDSEIGAMYRRDGVYETNPYTLKDKSMLPKDLDDFVARLARLPLAHEPGAQMTYGLSSDVMGLVIERAAGEKLDAYLNSHIFAPLGMRDTSFCVDEDKINRLANLYAYDEAVRLYLADKAESSVRRCPVGVFSGGSGLVSTAHDYWKFAEALRLGGGVILTEKSALQFETPQAFVDESKLGWWMGGTEWGLSVAQVTDPSKTDWKDVAGNYYWSGGASTYFWIDPKNEMVAIMFTQVERNGHPNTLKSDFRNLVYDAFIEAPFPGR